MNCSDVESKFVSKLVVFKRNNDMNDNEKCEDI